MANHPPIKVDPEVAAASLARVRAEIAAEVAAKRASGVEIHGCDFDAPEVEIAPAEVKRMVAEWNAEMRIRFPGPRIGEVSAAEREARMVFAIGQDRGVIPADEAFSWDPKRWKAEKAAKG